MMPAAFKELVRIVNKSNLKFTVETYSRLTFQSLKPLPKRHFQSLTSSICILPTSAAKCFGQVECIGTTAHLLINPESDSNKAKSAGWLEKEEPYHRSIKYSPPGSDRETCSDSSNGQVLSLDRQNDEASNLSDSDSADNTGGLEWSESDWESDSEEQQKRFSPHGPKVKRKYPREKKRYKIGKPAVRPPLPAFDHMLPRLQAYKEKFGDCLVPKRYWEDFELGDWAYQMRIRLRDKILPVRNFEVLDKMSFPWVVPVEVAQWEMFCHELRRYREEHGNIDVPYKWKDPMADFNNHFAKWFHAQPTLFLQRRLRPDQVRKLMLAGYDMGEVTGDRIGKGDYLKAQQEISKSSEKNEFEIMFAEMQSWRGLYYTTVVPRMVYDNPVLGMWAWKVRRDFRNDKLAQWKIDRLDSLEFLWKVDMETAKWHHVLHEARRYKEVHGTANVPADYRNPAEPGWQEVSRWLQRQAKLFRKQKLTDKRYRIIRQVLGIKFVRQYAPRVKENRKAKGIHETSKKKPFTPRYAPPIRKNILI